MRATTGLISEIIVVEAIKIDKAKKLAAVNIFLRMNINQLYTMLRRYSPERVRSEYSTNEIQLNNRSRSNC